MPCPSCGRLGSSRLCVSCAALVHPAPDRIVSGVLVRSLMTHEGPARVLVHRLKYQGVVPAGLGDALAALLPADASALIPVTRVLGRRWRYGVDPARELCRALARATGLPVFDCLAPPAWLRRRAGPAGALRGAPHFSCRALPPAGGVLVDDVVTTGTTLAAAAAASGMRRAVTLTAAQR